MSIISLQASANICIESAKKGALRPCTFKAISMDYI